MKVVFNDTLQMPTKRKYKINGQMIAPCSIARTGIMEYKAKECGALFADRDPDSTVKIMTKEEELFDAASIDSYRSAPITIGHPEEDVNTENSKELCKGVLEGMPMRDGEILVGTLVLNDADAISLVKANTSQLSSGHTCILKMADEGLEWDAEKTSIRANHIAIVKNGRAGVATIADEAIQEEFEKAEEIKEAEEIKNTEISLGDEALRKEVVELTAKLHDATEKLEKADKDIKKIEASIEEKVEARTVLVEQAKSLAPSVITKGKTEIEIRRAVVEAVKKMVLKDASDEYVNVRYQILLEDMENDDYSEMTSVLRDAAKAALMKQEHQPANLTAREKMIKRNEGVK